MFQTKNIDEIRSDEIERNEFLRKLEHEFQKENYVDPYFKGRKPNQYP